MDLSGRTPGYRGAAIRCPGCGDCMTQQALDECEVDLCASCGGLWVDWFDGEVRTVTRSAMRASRSQAPPPAERPSRNESIAIGACPRCTRQLAVERYAVDEQVTGAELLRCEDCMGVFVSKTSTEILTALPAETAKAATAKAASGQPPPSALERLVALLRRLFTSGAGSRSGR